METLKDKVVKIRKQQTCLGCADKFPSGSKLRYFAQADGGTIHSFYLCRPCDSVITEIYDEEDTITQGSVRDEEIWQTKVDSLARTFE